MIIGKDYYQHLSHSQFYIPILGFSAFFLMVSALIPFEVILIPAVAASPKRVKTICFSVVLGSALGAIALVFLTRQFGRPFIEDIFPRLMSSQGWTRAEDWIDRFGFWALIGTAALPIAQAPALILSGLLKISVWKVGLAFLLGKSFKYGLISYATLRGENSLKARFKPGRV